MYIIKVTVFDRGTLLRGSEVFEDLREDYAEGGVVSEDYPVPFVKLDPKDRESDDLGGVSYAEQMKKLGL